MIQKFLSWLGFNQAINVRRAHKAYRLNIGKSVLLHDDHEREQLVTDYENIYGSYPHLREHPHPALGRGEALVSLVSEVRDHW